MIIHKEKATPDQALQRIAYLVMRFGHLPGFRQPAMGKHAESRTPTPLILERLLHVREGEKLPVRQRSERGKIKQALQVICDRTVRAERAYREEYPPFKRTLRTQHQFVKTWLSADDMFQDAQKVAYAN